MNIAEVLLGWSQKMCDASRTEKLHRALAPHAYDGTELHHQIDRELPGIENALLAAAIKEHIAKKYHNTVRVDAATEVFLKLLEDGGLSS